MDGIEASSISISGLSSLISAFVSAAWYSKMPLTNSGAVLSLLDGPKVCYPAFQIVWARLRTIRYLACRPVEIRRIYKMLDGGLLQTVQRVELWRVILAVQALVLVFIGVDNLIVFEFVSKLVEGSEWATLAWRW